MKKLLILLLPLSLVVIPFLSGCGGGGGGTTTHSAGVGVIMQSRSDLALGLARDQRLNPAWKRIDLTPALYGPAPAREVRAPIDLSDKIAFFLLSWDRVNGATHYQVSYQGSVVWDSASVSIADPAFDANAPQAYLDLDDEVQSITVSGQYVFQIQALNGSQVVADLPNVAVSLGVNLQSLPEIAFASPNLSWSAVTNAAEYRIGFNGATVATVNAGTLAYNVSTVLTTPPQQDYDVTVDARYLDAQGRLAEITRGIYTIRY